MADMSKLTIREHYSKPALEQDDDGSMTDHHPAWRPGVARDITTGFSTAASALNTGQLVKDEFFTLFEAVGALEIMDPKMDSGHLRSGETLEDDYDVLRELLPEEVIGIMDQLLCFEMAWHAGHPLSQSLFTSLYLDRLLWPEPKSLEDARFDRNQVPKPENEMLHLVLRAYCLSLVKTCDFVHRRISKEHYYEEEDFVSNLYHRNLLTEFDVAEIHHMIYEALDYVSHLPNISITLRDALVIRLELRDSFLSAVQFDEIIDDHRVPSWDRCLRLIPALPKTTSLGMRVEASFSIKIQRRLASTVPPRPMVNISFDEAFDQLTRLCQNGKDAYRILDYRGGVNLMRFIWAYQSRTPQPSVYIRCLMQAMVFSEMRVLGMMSFKKLILDNLREIVLPADVLLDSSNFDVEAPQDPRFHMAKRMDDFMATAADRFLDIFRTLCMNRSRLRRILCHLVLEWDTLQFDAENFDTELRKYSNESPLKDANSSEDLWAFPLSSWAYYHKLQQMEWIVQMGFELDVYQIDELGGMYWYLQYLLSTRIQHLERIRTFTTRRLTRISEPTLEEMAAFRRSFSFLDFAMLEASATLSFADGLSCLFSFFAHLRLVPAPYHDRPYSTPEFRYNLRMRPFISISLPEVPSYQQFAALISLRTPDKNGMYGSKIEPTTQSEINQQAAQMLELAEQSLKAARREWEAVSKANAETARCQGCEEWWRTSVKNVMRACINANIVVSTAKKALANAGTRNARDVLNVEMVESVKGYHPWWVVPKISTK